MKTELIRGLDNLKPHHRGCVVAIGNFDGVHQGHQALLDRLKDQSQKQGYPALVMTFEPQPLEFFARGHTPPRLTRWREKFCLLAESGIERVLVVHFNAALAALSADAFINDILFRRLDAKHIIVGDDFKFGQGREGNVGFLAQRGSALGFTVEVMPDVIFADERISSTRVRKALAIGDHALAEQLLGRPYCMLGRVVYGNQLGRQLGFPTANIYLHREVSPVLGIYAVRLQDENKHSWPGVAYVGTRPTVQGTRTVLEVHLFDFDGDLYGQQVSVEFCKKLRDDKHFDNLELLKQQIAIDTEQARNYFMTDYKQTLNLPKTDFPMKANLAEREPKILHQWETLDLYAKLREQGKNRPRFIFHNGPPYANGHIHMGHAVNYVLKDMVVKSKTLSGFDASFVPGWDCHGLPIELNVEKKVGKPGHKVSAAEFRTACRDYASSFIKIQGEEFKRLGVQADWQHPYLTMDFAFEANIIRSLAQIVKNGHVQKGAKPVYWCLDCASALAEAEVEYADKTSAAIDVRFKVIDNEAFLARFKNKPKVNGSIAIPIWTTTPWTLPANEAVALNPEINYALVDCAGQECLVLAESLVEAVMQRYEIKDYKIIATIAGQSLEKVLLQHPFYERQVPVVLGEHVTVDAGTGAVHTAPAHGEDDYIIGKKYQLPLNNPVGDNGCYVADTLLFAGQHVNKINEPIIELLKQNNSLLHVAKVSHSYPHCWRHKTPLIFRATPQWFISMEQNGLRKMALKAIEQVNWVPDWGQGRITSMIANRPDWCISRQRAWGVPIPFFLHKTTGEMHPQTLELMEKVAERVEKQGIEAWFALDPKELLGAEADSYKKSLDTLDVWFDSGVAHNAVLRQRPELGFPADLYLEGSDQHRGWFQSSLLTSLAINQQPPYRTVLTHGYVLDMQARKMSKSLGNGVAPEEVIKKLGADILRLWASSTDYRGEIFVSDEVFARTAETYRRLRNTARFLLANLDGFDPEKNLVPPEKMLALDRWAVDKARLVQEEIIKAYDAYQFHLIYQKIHQFCSIEMGSFYLDIIKDRQYTLQTNSLARRSAQTAMFHIAEALVRWLAPILSFTAEEVWQYLPGKRNASVFLNTWYTQLAALPDGAVMDQVYWEKLQQVRGAVNKELEALRNAGKIGSALEADVQLYCAPELKQQLDALDTELRFALITSYAQVHLANSHVAPDVVQTDIAGLWVQVKPLDYAKCERCWHRREEVGYDKKHPTLCGRCIDNVDGAGEIRKFA